MLMAPAVADALASAHDMALPRETCGFLLGEARAGKAIVTDALVAGNAPCDLDGFEIPDHELRRAGATASERGRHIVALFHSHPSGSCRLSAGDRASLRHSEWPWVIVTRSYGSRAVTLTGYAPRPVMRIAVVIEAEY